MHRLSRSKSI